MVTDGFIPIDKAIKWLQNKLYGGFDSMCLDFGTKDECIETFINYQWHERPWLWEDFERLVRGWILKIVKFDEFVLYRFGYLKNKQYLCSTNF